MTRIAAGVAIPVTFRLREGYRIAGRRFDTAQNVLVRLTGSDGRTGLGCAAPFEEVTGETPAASLRVLEESLIPLAREAAGDGPAAIARRAAAIAPSHPAARAALDMAIHDLEAQRAGRPLWRHLGGTRPRIRTSVTLGIHDDLEAAVDRARRFVADGFVALKIKVGERWEFDAELVGALRRALGPEVLLRADANEGYDEEDAARFLCAAERHGLELLEQPLPAGNRRGLSRLRGITSIPIMADESVLTARDAETLIAEDAADLFNVKLMKCGGLPEGMAIAARAAAAGLGVMIGCNDESRIAIAAGLHLALAAPATDRADLDGDLDLQDDVARGGFLMRDGWMVATDAPGLGISADI